MKKTGRFLFVWVLIAAMVMPMTAGAAEASVDAEMGSDEERNEIRDVELPDQIIEDTDSSPDGIEEDNQEQENEGEPSGDETDIPEEEIPSDEPEENLPEDVIWNPEGDLPADAILESEELDIDLEIMEKEGRVLAEEEEETDEVIYKSPNEGFEDFGELTLVDVRVIEDEELIARAGEHGQIMLDPGLVKGNKTFSNNTKIKIKFLLICYGNELDEYRITIFRGKSLKVQDALTRKIGTFGKTVGTVELTFEWDTTDLKKYTEGTYTLQYLSVYNNGKEDIVNEHTETLKLEDYKTVATRNFVRRLYTKVFNRPADTAGLNDWTDKLVKGKVTGGEAVRGFIQSKEFANRNVSDSEYVDILYRTLFDREPDPSGKQNWMDALNTGMSRTFVLKGFIDGVEFDALCKGYGIKRGTINVVENRDKNRGATAFVWRFYQIALGRIPDIAGLNDWTGRLVSKKATPEDVGKGFIFSPEVRNKKLSNTEYVKLLYRTFLGREFDEAGLNDWVKRLDSGTSREDVFYGFSKSAEFGGIVASFGL